MAQSYFYPSSASAANPSVGPNGLPIVLSSTLVAGEDPTGLQIPVKVAADGAIIVDDLTPASVVTVVQPSGALLHTTVDSSALPTGAATAANQATEIASLASIDTKLTSPLAVTGPLTDVELRASAVPVSAASLPLPTGAATAANQATEIASLSSIDSKLTSPLAVTGPLTDAELRASAVPVSLASSPLPTGAATAANQATEIASLASIDTKLTSPLAVTGPLTDTQLRASAVPVISTPATPAALTITQAALAVGVTAVRLTVSGGAPAATRVALVVTPDSPSTAKFYIGSATVTSAGATRGVQISAGQTFIANNDAGDYYIVSDTAAQTVEVMEQG